MRFDWYLLTQRSLLTDRQTVRQGRVPLQLRRFFPSSPPRLSLLALFTHCCGFSSWCWDEWQLPFTSLLLEAWLPAGNMIAGLSVTPAARLSEMWQQHRLVFSRPSETWVKAAALPQMLKVIPGWLQGISVQGLSEREICP